jgi:predicted ATPase
LINDNWDDFGYKTLFQLIYFNDTGQRLDLGNVKIMSKGLTEGRVSVPSEFTSLGPQFCSLGQSQEYYETLLLIREDYRLSIVAALRDLVWDESIYDEFEEEQALQTSLMRGESFASIRKFRDILRSSARPLPYQFIYTFPSGQQLEFNVVPEVTPPTNIHVVIGRNGVGKTRLLSAISKLLRSRITDELTADLGALSFQLANHAEEAPRFANLIDVAFSVFDDFEPPQEGGTQSGIHYSYIGLRRRAEGEQPSRPKSLDEFAEEFVRSTLLCLRSSRRDHWMTAMSVLETDPIFASMALTQIDDAVSEDDLNVIYRRASSGHKIVLLSMTRLVELVGERTLVLIDEPEAHLHPPLAASFIRALSALLASRNGVAILATHSPVMLQEVPQDCVWLLFRTGLNVDQERPQLETFAENIGVLTREVFRLEVTNSGFHALVADAVPRSATLEGVIESFRGHLGAEGRALARVLWRKTN